MRVDGCGAVVVGGAESGFGEATASELARLGARVALLDESVSTSSQGGFTTHCGDTTDSNFVSTVLSAVDSAAPLRIVVSCASYASPQRMLSRQGPHSFDNIAETLRVNVLGPFNVARLAAPIIAAHDPVDGDRGVFVLMSSVAAFEGQIGQAAYAASKGALAALTLPMARDLARNAIRVVGVAPGFFQTVQTETLSDERKQAIADIIPHPPRMGHVREFADLVGHVIANPMINGTTIRIDGAVRFPPN